MTSFNSFLLYTFAKKVRLGSDVQSFLKRYQILSIIYSNFFYMLVIFSWEFISGILLDYPNTGKMIPICLVYTPISLFLLRRGRTDIAAGILIPYLHSLNFGAGYLKQPMAALYALMLIPPFGFFVASSTRLRIINLGLCFLQIIYHTYSAHKVFEFGLTREQEIQMNTLLLGSYVCLFAICLSCYVQKSVENNLWRMAQTNQENSEKLTQEVVQAAAAKDAFVSSLSHEIRNPLNSMTTSVEFLLETVKDPESLKILKNAKMSGQVLLNLVNNVLDVAKLRSEKMEIAPIEVNFDDILNRVLTINSENFKRTKILAKAKIDKKLPKSLWLDPSRFLQILMNLVSNAIKFTPQGGSIHILVKWCPMTAQKEDLLQPVDGQLLNKIRRPEGTQESPQANGKETFHNRSDPEDTMEFSREEEAKHLHNISCIKEFRVRGLEGLANSHFYSQQEPWTISRVSWRDQEGTALLESRKMNPRPMTDNLVLFNRSTNRTLNTSLNMDRSMKMSLNRFVDPPENGYLQVQVTDTGCGIAKEDISKLFGMFIQVHGTARVAYQGTGLGLWICKQLCNKMGGDIKVYSEVNKGTSFVFYIPVNYEKMNENIGGQFVNNTRDEVNVLIADDYAHNRELHKLLLEREGAVVSLATNGKEALQKYKEKGNGYYDFILMDVQMPEMDGFTAGKEIRAWEQENGWNKVHIYFVSGEYYNEDEVLASLKRSQGRSVDMAGVFSLRKPIDIQIVRRVLQKYKNHCSS